MITDIRAEIWTSDLPDTKRRRCFFFTGMPFVICWWCFESCDSLSIPSSRVNRSKKMGSIGWPETSVSSSIAAWKPRRAKTQLYSDGSGKPRIAIFFSSLNSPQWARASSLSRLHDHTQTHDIRKDSSGRAISHTCTCQHTTLTTDRHPCPRWDSNLQSQ